MKKFGGFHRKALVLALIPLVAHCGEPEQRFEVKVCDEKGQPMEAVACKAWFNKPKKGEMGLTGYRVDARTDKTGLAVLQGATSLFETTVVAEKKGCYKSGASKLWITGKKNAARWEPWPVEVDLVLKRIVNPHPMYAVKPGDGMKFEFPAGLSGPVGFDLMERDWVAPHGKGKVTDFILAARKSASGATGHFPPGDLTMTFPNREDGVIPMAGQAAGGSLLASPRDAPKNGYLKRLELSNRPLEDGLFAGLELRQRVWVFRVRSETDESGKLVLAHYGKIQCHPEILFFRRGPAFRMTYYLNAEPNDRSLEWDRKTNLFKDLPKEHWPRRP